MRIRRTFTREFKRQSAEAIISRWKKEYLEGKFFENNDPDYVRLEIRVKELERLVGKLTMENNTLKEIIKLVEPQKKGAQQIFTSKDWEMLRRGAK